MRFFQTKYLLLFSVFLALQGALGYWLNARREVVPSIAPLKTMAKGFASYSSVQDIAMEQEVKDVLKADDTLTRIFRDSRTGSAITLYIAFFKTQRSGVAPHSPKNCLPGNGWVPESEATAMLPVDGQSEPINVNRFLVQKGEEKVATIYWYQSRNRTVASEYKAKAYVIRDAIALNRTDTALVRVTVPVHGNAQEAWAVADDFVKRSFPAISAALPQ